MREPGAARLGCYDVLRCLAAFAVVILHCAGATLYGEDPASARFFVLNLLDGATRWAVPVFVMLTGAFLLDPDKPMGAGKWLGYMGRTALALAVWAFFYALVETRAAHAGLEWFLEALIRVVTGQLYYHLWYLPMLLGLYLLIPPLRALTRGASRGILWYLLGLWGAAALGLRTLGDFFPLWPGQPWAGLLRLEPLAGFWGYLLLGYLLRTCRPGPRREGLCYALGALGLVVTCTGTRLLSGSQGWLDDRLYSYLTPNVCLTAAAVFLAVRRLAPGKGTAWAKLSGLVFGAYLIHPVMLSLLQALGLPRPGWSAVWFVPTEALGLFAAALAAAWCLRRIPRIGPYIC